MFRCTYLAFSHRPLDFSSVLRPFLYFFTSIFFSGKDRIKRSTLYRKTREVNKNGYKFLEGALIVPKSYEQKYGTDKFATVLLAIANMVCLLGHVYDETILILS